jgi:dynein heavy chain
VINTYMDAFMCTSTIAVEAYKLTSSSEYYVPPDAPPLQSYKDFCAKLPTNDPPEAFGQHPNADIASQIASSMALLENLMSTNATLAKGGGSSDVKGSSI